MEPDINVPAQTAAPVVQPTTPIEPVTPVVTTTPAPAAEKPVEGLPDGARDKTREQFEKLLDNNRRLFEANELLRRQMEKRNDASQTFDPIQRAQAPQGGTQQINPAEFVETDPTTGSQYINTEKVASRMTELQQRATRSEQAVQNYIQTSEQREIERQNNEAFATYPELNPSDPKFDLGMHKLVRGALYDSMNFADERGGKPFTFKEAADFVRSQIPKAPMTPSPATKEEKQVAEDAAKAAQTLKEQSAAETTSQPRGKADISDEEELKNLVYKTRYLNDDEALAKRILNTDHVRKNAEDT